MQSRLKITMPPPAKNFLTLEQVAQLQQALKESELPHVRERILIILLQNDGRTQQEISKFLGCSPRTVAYWCMHQSECRYGFGTRAVSVYE